MHELLNETFFRRGMNLKITFLLETPLIYDPIVFEEEEKTEPVDYVTEALKNLHKISQRVGLSVISGPIYDDGPSQFPYVALMKRYPIHGNLGDDFQDPYYKHKTIYDNNPDLMHWDDPYHKQRAYSEAVKMGDIQDPYNDYVEPVYDNPVHEGFRWATYFIDEEDYTIYSPYPEEISYSDPYFHPPEYDNQPIFYLTDDPYKLWLGVPEYNKKQIKLKWSEDPYSAHWLQYDTKPIPPFYPQKYSLGTVPILDDGPDPYEYIWEMSDPAVYDFGPLWIEFTDPYYLWKGMANYEKIEFLEPGFDPYSPLEPDYGERPLYIIKTPEYDEGPDDYVYQVFIPEYGDAPVLILDDKHIYGEQPTFSINLSQTAYDNVLTRYQEILNRFNAYVVPI